MGPGRAQAARMGPQAPEWVQGGGTAAQWPADSRLEEAEAPVRAGLVGPEWRMGRA